MIKQTMIMIGLCASAHFVNAMDGGVGAAEIFSHSERNFYQQLQPLVPQLTTAECKQMTTRIAHQTFADFLALQNSQYNAGFITGVNVLDKVKSITKDGSYLVVELTNKITAGVKGADGGIERINASMMQLSLPTATSFPAIEILRQTTNAGQTECRAVRKQTPKKRKYTQRECAAARREAFNEY